MQQQSKQRKRVEVAEQPAAAGRGGSPRACESARRHRCDSRAQALSPPRGAPAAVLLLVAQTVRLRHGFRFLPF